MIWLSGEASQASTKIPQNWKLSNSFRQFQQERTLFPPDKQSCKLSVSRDKGTRNKTTKKLAQGSRHEDNCTYSTSAEQSQPRFYSCGKKNQKQTKTKAKAIKKFQIQLNARKEIT